MYEYFVGYGVPVTRRSCSYTETTNRVVKKYKKKVGCLISRCSVESDQYGLRSSARRAEERGLISEQRLVLKPNECTDD